MAVAAAGMAASVVSAYIMTVEAPLPPVYFAYNPEAGFQMDYQAHYKTTPKSGGPPMTPGHTAPQYQGTTPTQMSVDILLDAFAIPPIPPQVSIEILKQYLQPSPLSDPTAPRPPKVTFGWGPNIIMESAYVTKLSVKHERFLLGIPIRAKATVTLSDAAQYQLPGTNPTSGGLATRKTYTTVEGDTLASVAYREYRDPAKWRALAIANAIDDPMRVKPGTELDIPDKREADALMA